MKIINLIIVASIFLAIGCGSKDSANNGGSNSGGTNSGNIDYDPNVKQKIDTIRYLAPSIDLKPDIDDAGNGIFKGSFSFALGGENLNRPMTISQFTAKLDKKNSAIINSDKSTGNLNCTKRANTPYPKNQVWYDCDISYQMAEVDYSSKILPQIIVTDGLTLLDVFKNNQLILKPLLPVVDYSINYEMGRYRNFFYSDFPGNIIKFTYESKNDAKLTIFKPIPYAPCKNLTPVTNESSDYKLVYSCEALIGQGHSFVALTDSQDNILMKKDQDIDGPLYWPIVSQWNPDDNRTIDDNKLKCIDLSCLVIYNYSEGTAIFGSKGNNFPAGPLTETNPTNYSKLINKYVINNPQTLFPICDYTLTKTCDDTNKNPLIDPKKDSLATFGSYRMILILNDSGTIKIKSRVIGKCLKYRDNIIYGASFDGVYYPRYYDHEGRHPRYFVVYWDDCSADNTDWFLQPADDISFLIRPVEIADTGYWQDSDEYNKNYYAHENSPSYFQCLIRDQRDDLAVSEKYDLVLTNCDKNSEGKKWTFGHGMAAGSDYHDKIKEDNKDIYDLLLKVASKYALSAWDAQGGKPGLKVKGLDYTGTNLTAHMGTAKPVKGGSIINLTDNPFTQLFNYTYSTTTTSTQTDTNTKQTTTSDSHEVSVKNSYDFEFAAFNMKLAVEYTYNHRYDNTDIVSHMISKADALTETRQGSQTLIVPPHSMSWLAVSAPYVAATGKFKFTSGSGYTWESPIEMEYDVEKVGNYDTVTALCSAYTDTKTIARGCERSVPEGVFTDPKFK